MGYLLTLTDGKPVTLEQLRDLLAKLSLDDCVRLRRLALDRDPNADSREGPITFPEWPPGEMPPCPITFGHLADLLAAEMLRREGKPEQKLRLTGKLHALEVSR